MKNDAGRELVDVIDEQGQTIAVVSRSEMRARRLPHRCTYILVFNQRGELFIHLRTATKDVYPSHWDIAAGGVVAAGESFAEGAQRELSEELGIEADLEELFAVWYEGAASVAQGMVYRTVHDGPFRLQPEEVVRGEFLPLDQVALRIQQDPFCPDGLSVLREYQQRASSRT